MPVLAINNFGGINTNENPMALPDGAIIRSVNYVSDPFGTKTKRPGFGTTIGTVGGYVSAIWQWNNGQHMYYYASANNGLTDQIFYSLEGTGAWTLCGNGTVRLFNPTRAAILNEVMTITDEGGSTRYTTNGTSFTNTTGAPADCIDVVQFQQRIYTAVPGNTLQYSSYSDATNWSSTGTSDSSSLGVPGGGDMLGLQANNDRLLIFKDNGEIFRWDGQNMVDLTTQRGPLSLFCAASFDTNVFWANEQGIYSYGGIEPQIISNPIQRYFYNTSGSSFIPANHAILAAAVHYYNYTLLAGTITDNFTGEHTSAGGIITYDQRLNEFLTWDVPYVPTVTASLLDTNQTRQLIVGDNRGLIYKLDPTRNDDYGTPIASALDLVIHNNTMLEKDYYIIRAMFNPGCEARLQYAITNSFTKQNKMVWKDAGQVVDGIVEYSLPAGSRGRLLFIRITDSGRAADHTLYEIEVEYDVVKRR